MSDYSKYNPENIKRKSFDKMSRAEKDWFQMEAESFARNLFDKHRDQDQFLLAVGRVLRDEAGKRLYQDVPSEETLEEGHSDELTDTQKLFGR